MRICERLFAVVYIDRVGIVGRVIYLYNAAIGQVYLIYNARHGCYEVEVIFALKALLYYLEMEQTEEAAVTEPTEPSDTSSTPAATTIRTAATEATSSEINYGQLYAEPESPVMLIVIIVGVAVVIVAGAIIGYMIYRKKKFY